MSTDVTDKMPHPVKIVIAGNHDLTLDEELVTEYRDHLRSMFRLSDKGSWVGNYHL